MKNIRYYESIDELERNLPSLQFYGVDKTTHGYVIRIKPIAFSRRADHFIATSIHINLPELEKTGLLKGREYLLWDEINLDCYNIVDEELIKRIEKKI